MHIESLAIARTWDVRIRQTVAGAADRRMEETRRMDQRLALEIARAAEGREVSPDVRYSITHGEL